MKRVAVKRKHQNTHTRTRTHTHNAPAEFDQVQVASAAGGTRMVVIAAAVGLLGGQHDVRTSVELRVKVDPLSVPVFDPIRERGHDAVA